MDVVKDKSLINIMDIKIINDLEAVKNNYLYTRRVNIPYMEISQSLSSISYTIGSSIKIRGGFSK